MEKRNQLDERQEQIVLKIEHNGCWFAFWALILAVYLCGACLKNGIWDRHLKANGKTNFAVSAIASVVLGILVAAGSAIRYPGHLAGSLAGGVIAAVCCFVLCFVIMTILARSYRKRNQEMEREPEDE